MLAPRKTLWSTPDAAIDKVAEMIELRPVDRVCDIGCGDGRVILRWASLYSQKHLASQPLQASNEHDDDVFPSFLGIDIDPERIEQANLALKHAQAEGWIDSRLSITFVCANALEWFGSNEQHPLLQLTSVYFLYLIPRGLRQIKPRILQHFAQRRCHENSKRLNTPQDKKDVLKIVTYMAPLENEIPTHIEAIQVSHQAGASWPLYFYQFDHERLKVSSI